MNEDRKKLILQTENHWKDKTFLLGANLHSSNWNEWRENYIIIYLGFWNLIFGFKHFYKNK